MAKKNGFAVLMSLGASSPTKVPHQTESSITLTANTEDVTDKDDVVDGKLYPSEEVIYTGAELSCTCYADDDATLGIKVGDTVKWAFTGLSGNYSGTGLVTSITDSGSVNGKGTLQINVKSVGAFTQA